MTVADNYDIEKQATNGTTKIFSFNFYTSSKDFVKVIFEADGEQSVVPTTDYTIKLNTVGGTVTFTRAPASGGYIIITRETPREQETSFATSSGFPAKTVEGRFDKLTAMIQEIQDTGNRTPSFPVGTDLNVTLPLPEAGKALVWNDTEDNLENSETTFDEIVSDAISAKDDAVAAKEAAEAAQGKAEDAQRDAEAAQSAAEIAQGKAEDAKTSAENTVAGFDDHADSKIGEVNTLVGQAEGYATVAENKANAAAGSANDADGYATAASGYASSASTSASNAAVWAEGIDEEVEALGGEHSAKGWAGIVSDAIGDGTLTIQRNSQQLATFTANSSTNTTVNIYVPTTPEEINALPATTTINDLTTSSQQDALNSGITSTGVTQITTNKNNITSISAVIPEQATDQNQLADKSFVNSSIATNTADFIGTFNSVAELEGYAGPVTNNDYAFVVGTDSAGNTTYDRYKYTDSTTPASWVFEYTLNNSSFTAAQWAAINSNATDTKIAQITTNKTAIGTLSSLTTTEKTNLVGAVNELDSTKQDNLPTQTGNNGKFLKTNGSTLSWDSVDALPSQSGQSGKFLTTNGSDASWENLPISNMATTNTAQDITATKTFKAQQRIQSGQADGCLIVGADVAATTLTNGTRKLGRLGFPTNEDITLNCAFVSCDTQSAAVAGVVENSVDFGGRVGDTTSTSPDALTFTVAKEHNTTNNTKKQIALRIDKNAANFTVQPQFNGNDLVDVASTQTITGNKTFSGNTEIQGTAYNNTLVLKRSSTLGCYITFKNNQGVLGHLGLIESTGAPRWLNSNNTENRIMVRAGGDSTVSVGDASTPVYIDSNGIATVCSSSIPTIILRRL